MPITALLVDDHQIMRQGLRALLEKEEDIQVVGEADNGRLALQLADQLAPDVIIMDVEMPGLNGIETTRQIRASSETIQVIALSMHDDRRFVTSMLRAGAAGYVLKHCAFLELVLSIRAISRSQMYLSPAITGVVVRDYRSQFPMSDYGQPLALTAREREVLQLIAEGQSTRDIATSLHVSVRTIDSHRAQIMTKLNLHSVAELTKYAIREGLTAL